MKVELLLFCCEYSTLSVMIMVIAACDINLLKKALVGTSENQAFTIYYIHVAEFKKNLLVQIFFYKSWA